MHARDARARTRVPARRQRRRKPRAMSRGPPCHQREGTVSHALSASRLQSHKYLAFEDAFRGDPALIAARQRDYVSLFAGCQRCARYWLRPRRVSSPPEGQRRDRARHRPQPRDGRRTVSRRGLDATEADALAYLRAPPRWRARRADRRAGGRASSTRLPDRSCSRKPTACCGPTRRSSSRRST